MTMEHISCPKWHLHILRYLIIVLTTAKEWTHSRLFDVLYLFYKYIVNEINSLFLFLDYMNGYKNLYEHQLHNLFFWNNPANVKNLFVLLISFQFNQIMKFSLCLTTYCPRTIYYRVHFLNSIVWSSINLKFEILHEK